MMRQLSGLLVLATLVACSEPPQPVGEGDLLFAGRAVLADELAGIESGSVFVNVFNQRGDRIPSYSRKYELDDPAFRAGDEGLVLSFALDQTHNMVGMGMPLGDDPQIEVRYDPDGAVETKDGVRSAWTAARRGTTGIALVLDRNAVVPEPSSRPTSQPASQPASRPTEQ